MSALTAASVTVSLNLEDIDRSPDGRIGRRTFPTVAFGTGSLTYPTLGIPMPAIGNFGFEFAIKRAYIEQPANGFIYHFDRANHKLRVFQGAAQAALTLASTSGGTPAGNVVEAAHSHDLIIAANTAGATDAVIGANSANKLVANIATAYTIPGGVAANGGVANVTPANAAFTGAALATHTHAVTGGGAVAAGALVELTTAAGDAPAATTLYMEMVGR